MKNYFNEINLKLKKNINIEHLEIIDNTSKHLGHKTFTPGQLHIHLKIKSMYLNSLSRLSAQKLVMKVLKEDLQTKIHALEISIEK